MQIKSKILSQEALLNAAQNEDWGRLWPLLVGFITKRLTYRYGIREPKDALIDRSEKILSEVLDKILVEGTRNWNTEEYETFVLFIHSVIDSHINNSFNKGKQLETSSEDILSSLANDAPNEIEYQEFKNGVIEFLQREGADDEELIVFECMADGITKPKNIRCELGIDDRLFHNIWRRLQKKLIKVIKYLDDNEKGT